LDGVDCIERLVPVATSAWSTNIQHVLCWNQSLAKLSTVCNRLILAADPASGAPLERDDIIRSLSVFCGLPSSQNPALLKIISVTG